MQYPVNDQEIVMNSLEMVKLASGRLLSICVFEGEKGKRDSFVVVAKLSPMLTAKLVDRGQELESQVAKPIAVLQTLPEALRFAASLAEQKAQLASKLAIAAPKADFVDHFVEAKGLVGFREAAKILKVKETGFRLFLLENNIIYRLAGKMIPYSQHLVAGRFQVKTGEAGNEHVFTQVKFTPKGIQWIAGLMAVKNMKGAA